MLFLTNRSLCEGKQSKINRKITFDLSDNAPNNAIYCCLRQGKEDYLEIGFIQFTQRLRESAYQQILLFIHGFNCLPEVAIFPTVQRLQKHFDELEQHFMLVVPIIWPCDNDIGVIKDYWDDSKAADMSGFSLARALNKFLYFQQQQKAMTCLKRINILAHSMGNRVLRETLKIWNKYDTLVGIPQFIRNIYMVAADIKNNSLEDGQPGELIAQASRNVIVYYAHDDWLLNSSKAMNFNGRVLIKRLGHSGPISLDSVPSNVYVVDCDDFNNTYDPPFGHSYFLNQTDNKQAGVLFAHIYNTAKTGRLLFNNKEVMKL